MNCNVNFISRFLPFCFSIIIFVSCESKEKPNEAFEEFKEDKIVTNDSIQLQTQNAEEIKTIVPPEKSTSEWLLYKNETERKIQANEKKIRELRTIPNQNMKLLVKINHLEKQNTGLRTKLDEYEKEVKQRWEEFKTNMNADLAGISDELKEMPSVKK